MKKPTVEEWMEHAEKHTHTAFHWPDHTIGKRESRAIRESHNALYNDYHRLVAALELCERALEVRDAEAEEFAAKNARAALNKAKG
jgi:hypothetical protein